MRFDYFTESEKKEYDEVCALIDSIKTAYDFYPIMRKINENYSCDIINLARHNKQCFNSAQYPMD